MGCIAMCSDGCCVEGSHLLCAVVERVLETVMMHSGKERDVLFTHECQSAVWAPLPRLPVDLLHSLLAVLYSNMLQDASPSHWLPQSLIVFTLKCFTLCAPSATSSGENEYPSGQPLLPDMTSAQTMIYIYMYVSVYLSIYLSMYQSTNRHDRHVLPMHNFGTARQLQYQVTYLHSTRSIFVH